MGVKGKMRKRVCKKCSFRPNLLRKLLLKLLGFWPHLSNWCPNLQKKKTEL